MKKIFLLLILFLITTVSQAKVLKGKDKYGYNCRLKIDSLKLIPTEDEERRTMMSGEEFSTTKRKGKIQVTYSYMNFWGTIKTRSSNKFEIKSRGTNFLMRGINYSLSVSEGHAVINDKHRNVVIYFGHEDDFETPISFSIYESGLNGLVVNCRDLQ